MENKEITVNDWLKVNDVWVNITYTFDGKGNHKRYIDGKLSLKGEIKI